MSIWKRYDPERRKEMHHMALEACLLEYKMHLDNLKAVDKKIANIRNKALRRLTKEFSRNKTIFQNYRKKRQNYWKTHGAPIASKLQDGHERLVEQLRRTQSEFPQLTDAIRNKLAEIVAESRCDIRKVQHPIISNIITTWNLIMEKLQQVLQEGGELLPAVESLLSAFRSDIDTALQVA